MNLLGKMQHGSLLHIYAATSLARKDGDRPLVVPNGSKNIAFIGNFAETPRDTVFTGEYSVHCSDGSSVYIA